jgi:hypothetical protein
MNHRFEAMLSLEAVKKILIEHWNFQVEDADPNRYEITYHNGHVRLRSLD